MSCIRCLHGKEWRDHVEEDQLGCTPLCEACEAELAAGDEDSPAAGEAPEEGPFACGFCDKETKSARGMRRHIAAKHAAETPAEGPFKCGYCGLSTKTERNMHLHTDEKHPGLVLDYFTGSAAETPKDGPFTCEICGHETETSLEVEQHLISKHHLHPDAGYRGADGKLIVEFQHEHPPYPEKSKGGE